ncbi:MAG: AraC family transcriptional regulator [Flavobacteriales bacterium]|nr:AraC family transcriptional regulator [Flavobacteriales bacterium]
MNSTQKSVTTHDESVTIIHLKKPTEYELTEVNRNGHFELYFFENGGGKHMIDFEDFPVEGQSIHLVAPGQVHHLVRTDSCKGFAVLFDPELLESSGGLFDFLFDHISSDVRSFSPVYRFDKTATDRIQNLIVSMYREIENPGEFSSDYIVKQLNLLCLQCMQTLEEYQLSVSVQKDSGAYRAFRKLLHENFREMRKVKDYAREIGISEKQLNRIISARTTLSASAMIYQKITAEAKRLLGTGTAVKDVAYLLNFDEPAHFSKFFKAQTGSNPSDYLK